MLHPREAKDGGGRDTLANLGARPGHDAPEQQFRKLRRRRHGGISRMLRFEPVEPLRREQGIERLDCTDFGGLQWIEHRSAAGGDDLNVDLPVGIAP